MALFVLLGGAARVLAGDAAVDLDAKYLIDPISGDSVAIGSGAKVYHLVFFATWCGPCIEEFGRLSDSEARWGQQDYRLVLVAVPTRQDASRLAAFVQGEKPPGRVVLDATGRLTKELAVEAIPAHYVLDATGRVTHEAERFQDGVYDAIARTMHRPAGEKSR